MISIVLVCIPCPLTCSTDLLCRIVTNSIKIMLILKVNSNPNFYHLFHHNFIETPLTFLPSCQSNRHSPRQVRHLDYILQFTSDIRHIRGTDNAVADALSRVHSLTSNMLPTLNLQVVAAAQTTDSQLETLSKNPDTHSHPPPSTPPFLPYYYHLSCLYWYTPPIYSS